MVTRFITVIGLCCALSGCLGLDHHIETFKPADKFEGTESEGLMLFGVAATREAQTASSDSLHHLPTSLRGPPELLITRTGGYCGGMSVQASPLETRFFVLRAPEGDYAAGSVAWMRFTIRPGIVNYIGTFVVSSETVSVNQDATEARMVLASYSGITAPIATAEVAPGGVGGRLRLCTP
jgi:hypothetical protein